MDDTELRRLVGAACARGPRHAPKQVLEGVSHLLAELAVTSASGSEGGGGGGSQRSRWAERVWQGGMLHTAASRTAAAQSKPKKGKGKPAEKKSGAASAAARVVEQRLSTGRYSKYLGREGSGWSCPLRSVAPHVTLAVNRGESEKVLSVSVQLPQHVSSAIERELVSACAGRVQAASPAGTVVRW